MWRERHYVLIVSQAQLDRMQDVLQRPRLEPFLNQKEAAALMADIQDAAVIVEHEASVGHSIDPEDNIIIGTAIAGKADLLVSGDKKHLLSLGSVDSIFILTPREAIDRILGE
ncbi:MAG: putative toxin-antitoxin system toxin component, PIN family [Pirellulales bacterium]|nr:putative toxin-antitoxin system toxin component, PIN family [Pirellulales bacterium]